MTHSLPNSFPNRADPGRHRGYGTMETDTRAGGGGRGGRRGGDRRRLRRPGGRGGRSGGQDQEAQGCRGHAGRGPGARIGHPGHRRDVHARRTDQHLLHRRRGPGRPVPGGRAAPVDRVRAAGAPPRPAAGPANGIWLLLGGTTRASATQGYQLDVERRRRSPSRANTAGRPVRTGSRRCVSCCPVAIEKTDRAARAVDRPRRLHRRLPALRLPRRDARRGPALLPASPRSSGTSTRSPGTRSTTCTCTSATTRAGGSPSTAGPSWPRSAARPPVGGGTGRLLHARPTTRRSWPTPQSRYITVVPEIDMPGHVNAALACYAELNCDGVAPPPYTGTDVGFSSLCISKDITYTFIDDVVRELAAITPGPYLHIGGDEAARHHAGRLRGVHEPGTADRGHPRQVGRGLAPDRRRHAGARHGRRSTGALDHQRERGRGRGEGHQAAHVTGQQGVPRHEVQRRRPSSARPGPGTSRSGPRTTGTRAPS